MRTASPEVATGDSLVRPISERDHIQGSLDAPVGLVEYGDYECPFCARAYWIVKAIQQRLNDQVCFAYRNFPLANIHLHAERAAEAAEAAGAQDRFWEMHDILYENQDALDDSDLARYAETLGLNVDRFVADLVAHTYAGRVREDFRSGVRSGVNGTPTFFINNLRYDGPADLESMVAALSIAAATGDAR